MYSFGSRVRYSEVTEDGVLSILGLIDYLQDCSTFHSEDVGLGVEVLKARGIAWFISNWEIIIDRLPRFGERIVVSTWAYGFSSLYGERNFSITDVDGSMCVRADSLWFLYDFDTERPVRVPADISAPYFSGNARLDMPDMKRHISVVGEGRATRAIAVNEQHLDQNHHVNNAQYVQMAIDALTVDDFGKHADIARIDVQYKKAAVLGDLVVPHLHNFEDGAVVDLTDESGTTYALMELTARQ